MKKRFSIFLLVTAFCIFGCKKNSTQNNSSMAVQKNERAVIGFSIDTLAIERWRRDCDVFISYAREYGADVIVQNAGNSVEEQIRQIQYLIDKNVNAIVIVAKQADSLTEVIKNAKAKNIPVISYDRLILNANIDLYLTIDSQKVGELMSQEILKKAPIGTLFCIYGPLDDFNMTMIKTGVEKTIVGSQLKTGHVFFTDNWNYDLSYSHMVELLEQGKIPTAVICGNDSVANSVIQAIQDIKPGKKIFIAGQDADIVNCQHIVSGKQTVTIYKPITELSKQAAFYAVKLANGFSVENLPEINSTINNGFGEIPTLLLNPVAVTKDNIDEIIIQSGFHTESEVYQR